MYTHSHTQTIQLLQFNHFFGMFNAGEIPDGFLGIYKNDHFDAADGLTPLNK